MSENCSLDLKIGFQSPFYTLHPLLTFKVRSTQMNHNIIDSTGPSVIFEVYIFPSIFRFFIIGKSRNAHELQNKATIF